MGRHSVAVRRERIFHLQHLNSNVCANRRVARTSESSTSIVSIVLGSASSCEWAGGSIITIMYARSPLKSSEHCKCCRISICLRRPVLGDCSACRRKSFLNILSFYGFFFFFNSERSEEHVTVLQRLSSRKTIFVEN